MTNEKIQQITESKLRNLENELNEAKALVRFKKQDVERMKMLYSEYTRLFYNEEDRKKLEISLPNQNCIKNLEVELNEEQKIVSSKEKGIWNLNKLKSSYQQICQDVKNNVGARCGSDIESDKCFQILDGFFNLYKVISDLTPKKNVEFQELEEEIYSFEWDTKPLIKKIINRTMTEKEYNEILEGSYVIRKKSPGIKQVTVMDLTKKIIYFDEGITKFLEKENSKEYCDHKECPLEDLEYIGRRRDTYSRFFDTVYELDKKFQESKKKGLLGRIFSKQA
jgi:hypothetical protein